MKSDITMAGNTKPRMSFHSSRERLINIQPSDKCELSYHLLIGTTWFLESWIINKFFFSKAINTRRVLKSIIVGVWTNKRLFMH